MEMFKTILSLGTGSLWKGVSILLAGALIAMSLFILEEEVSLRSTISDNEKVIKEQGGELTKKESKIKELQEKVSLKQAEIGVQNATIAANKADTEKNLKAVNDELLKISKKYNDFKDEVKNWKGDQNASSCDNARAFLNSRTW
ncbi:hypothetical protein [Sulfurospirillum cavolei]|uniref:hypothetical protein n=1 Tax=Sulfurospirillum cavolei TaxID=366522 RepID=UPI000764BA04|nr:hypothetical protein [Sulfurospirillum cavolei]